MRRETILALVAIVGLTGGAALADYAATIGAGTNFKSFVNGGVHSAGFAAVDSTGVDATDTTAHAVKTTVPDGVNIVEGGLADASAAVGGTGSLSAKLRRVTTQLDAIQTAATSAIPAGTAIIGKVGIDQTTDGTTNLVAAKQSGTFTVGQTNQYPATAVPYTATATGTTGATTATLAGAASVTTYLCGFSIRANATAAATGNATVTGVITATLNFTQWTAPNATGLGITEMIFAPCVPASATNTSIAVVSAAPGTGGVVSVTAWGYKL